MMQKKMAGTRHFHSSNSSQPPLRALQHWQECNRLGPCILVEHWPECQGQRVTSLLFLNFFFSFSFFFNFFLSFTSTLTNYLFSDFFSCIYSPSQIISFCIFMTYVLLDVGNERTLPFVKGNVKCQKKIINFYPNNLFKAKQIIKAMLSCPNFKKPVLSQST